jgi:cobalt-precorrin 5A hydrolase
MIFAGVGCRANCDVEDLASSIAAALQSAERDLAEVHALYAPDFKKGEPCLSLITDKLGKPLILLSLTELEKHSHLALTSSERVKQRYGVPSIAETAALAGAHAFSRGLVAVRLVGPRTIHGGATCALAEGKS